MKAKENLLRAIRRDAPAWVPDGLGGPVYLENVATIWSPVVERSYVVGPDAFGALWDVKPEAEGGSYPQHDGHPIRDFSEWREKLVIPDLDALDWEKIRQEVAEVDRDTNLVMGFVEMGIFERSYLLFGMNEALIRFLTDPDEMAELADKIADYKVALISRFDDEVNLDMVWYGDDWGTQDQLFIPPEIWRKTIKPGVKKIYDCMQSRNILINQHSCGMILDIVPDIVELGCDILNPCQPCNDLATLKQEFGEKLTFHGGIDSQFVLDRPGVTAAEVRAEAKKVFDILAPGGGYIAGPSHHVPHDPELLAALKDEVDTYGKTFYS